MNDAALAVVDVHPDGGIVRADTEGLLANAMAIMAQAKDVAGLCREIVMRTALDLQGRKYVRVEGWQSIAVTFGCMPSIREVVEDERGIKAVAELRRQDGTVLASAEGYCGLDEPRWASQPLYARRGMAQTRAISRVCRSAFAFVVTLIDANLSTTPAEEIPQADAPRAAPVVREPTPKTAGPAPERSKATTVRFGKSKGKFLCDLEASDLAWQHAAAQKSVQANDPKWGDANKAWLATVDAEIARRNLGPADAQVAQ